jgi:hypothetical protein
MHIILYWEITPFFERGYVKDLWHKAQGARHKGKPIHTILVILRALSLKPCALNLYFLCLSSLIPEMGAVKGT